MAAVTSCESTLLPLQIVKKNAILFIINYSGKRFLSTDSISWWIIKRLNIYLVLIEENR